MSNLGYGPPAPYREATESGHPIIEDYGDRLRVTTPRNRSIEVESYIRGVRLAINKRIYETDTTETIYVYLDAETLEATMLAVEVARSRGSYS